MRGCKKAASRFWDGSVIGVPTIAEQGLPAYELDGWIAPVAPAGLPKTELARLYNAFKAAMEQESYKTALARYDMLPMYMSSAAYTRFAQDTFAREKALVTKLGLLKTF